MITDAIILFCGTILNGMFSLLPDWPNLVADFSSLGTTIGNAASVFKNWFPVGVLSVGLLTIMVWRIALGVWNICIWVWEKLPFN